MSHRVQDFPRAEPPESLATAPLLFWLIPQFLALIVATTRINLWARYPQPGELMALRLLLSVQLCIASLLFPLLLRDIVSTIAVIVSAWPLTLVAGSLSATPIKTSVESEMVVTVFLLALACWTSILTRIRAAHTAVAITSLWTMGGPLLLYLRVEFNDAAPPIIAILAGPLFGLQRLLSGEMGFFSANICASVVAATGLTMHFVWCRKRSAQAAAR